MIAVSWALGLLRAIPAKVWLIIAIVAVVLAAGVIVYKHGYQSARSDALAGSVKALRERENTNEEVKGLSDADLCRRLGGVPDDNGECM